jgi:sporulation protein YlmC with PRC-barrel domain
MTYTSIYALGVALALAASPALAQSNTSPPAQRGPAATAPSGSSSTTAPRNQLPSDISAMKAGDLVGKSVYDDKGDRIGEVDDVVMNKSNKQAAAVIGVGGFLGIGERKAAVPLNQLKVQDNKIVGTGLTKDSVKSMAEYKDSDSDQWDKMDRDRMLTEATSGAAGSSTGSTGAVRPGGSTPSTPGATNPSSGSATDRSGASSPSGSSSMPSGTSGTSGSTSSSGTATGSPSTSPSSPSGATSPSGSSMGGSSTGGSSSMGGSSSSGSSSANPAASSNPPDNSTPTQKK